MRSKFTSKAKFLFILLTVPLPGLGTASAAAQRSKMSPALAPTLLAGDAFPLFKHNPPQTKPAKPRSTPKRVTSQDPLIDRAIAREAVVIRELKQRHPVAETYIQDLQPLAASSATPKTDTVFLSRVDFGRVIGDTPFAKSPEHADKTSRWHQLSGLFGTGSGHNGWRYSSAGFLQTLLVDSNSFDRKTYMFYYVRKDFLGGVPTEVFDVVPSGSKAGRFEGKIWIERKGGNIVRFAGKFHEGLTGGKYFAFDSWRTNVQENLWLPATVYSEDADPKSPTQAVRMKARIDVWGYAIDARPEGMDSVAIDIVGAVDHSSAASDHSPLEAERAWQQHSADNVVESQYRAGLIAAPGDFEASLSTIANNIALANGIKLITPIEVRVLLTTPLETATVDNTILISKSLIDTASTQSGGGEQFRSNLTAILAFPLAHILLGHRIDTKFAFDDNVNFAAPDILRRIQLSHSEEQNAAAAKRAADLLSAPGLRFDATAFSFYLQQLTARQAGLPELTRPQIGDGLLTPSRTPWMPSLSGAGVGKAQEAALPLGAYLAADPWTDTVAPRSAVYTPLTTQDGGPFGIEAVYLKPMYFVKEKKQNLPPVLP